MKSREIKKHRQQAYRLLKRARIVITPEEQEALEVSDLGLNDCARLGLQVLVYENNDRYSAKELVMLPRQICPEHRHPPVSDKNVGKQETFRCRWGEIYLYVEGEPTPQPRAQVPDEYKKYITVWKEIVLTPGGQYTLKPDTRHWFQSGDQGAVLSEFSSTSLDELDIFSDPRIRRVAES